ncbi:MAG: hypothetical protein KGN79_04325 [Acidobacteriota bacterium]|nr:hypothetical protein [Acidobacteriota bacterium]
MKTIRIWSRFGAALLMGAIALMCVGKAIAQSGAQSGEVTLGNSTVEPAFDDTTGGVTYLLTPKNAPLPSKANAAAVAPLYLVVYPLNSAVQADTLNCQPTNCDHVNVLPFPDPDYGAMPGDSTVCTDFNGGAPCSLVKGHDHLVGIANTGGDYNVAWAVKLVFFTHAAFLGDDPAINHRVTTLSQIEALQKAGEVVVADTPIVFNCSKVSGATYAQGVPVVINFP